MTPLNNRQLIQKLRSEESSAYGVLYDTCFPSIKYYVTSNSGSDAEAADVFQEAVIVLVQKMRMDDFELTSSVKTYLFSVAKNLWLKQLRQGKKELNREASFWDTAGDQLAAETSIEPQHEKQVHTLMKVITVHCKRILDFLFFKNQSMEKLMALMGWKNKHTADNQKYKCIQQIKKAAAGAPSGQ